MVADGPGSVERLIELGFSHYEARAYVGLLGQPPITGYALSNLTGIPQPKVYETLRRLARKGAAVLIEGEPVRFVALPPAQLLTQLETAFHRRLADAEVELTRSVTPAGEGNFRVLPVLTQWDEIEKNGVEMIDGARRHIYLSLNCGHAAAVISAIGRADGRGVQSDILHFGPAGVEVTNGRLLRHLSTDGVVYRHHQARHLALVVDGTQVLWALAADGTAWDALRADDHLLAAAVKGYVRHDMYVQQMAKDFGDILTERYGPGLEGLVTPDVAARPPRASSKSRRRKLTA
jgi:HTH-type transcriptional regulator, sugar sensing transcriptional regulator